MFKTMKYMMMMIGQKLKRLNVTNASHRSIYSERLQCLGLVNQMRFTSFSYGVSVTAYEFQGNELDVVNRVPRQVETV